MKKILVTGGCGYIGSHTVLGLLDKGYSVTIIDNFSNSSSKSLDSIKKLSNNSPKFYKVDILDKLKLSKVVREGEFDAIMHFAAHKSIIESYQFPEKYYENNIVGTLNF